MLTESSPLPGDYFVDSRNLVVCIDGTSNKFGQRNTNVVKLYGQIQLGTDQGSEPQQHAYYSSGIGTHPKRLSLLHGAEKVISHTWDKIFAWNVEKNVKDAYSWLARKYQKGDKIYLFGFSRGAYQVRILANLIHEVGLIRTPTEKQIEMVFGHYRCIHPHKPETREMATEFKRTYCWRAVRIHFIGVWDTVSSVGLIRDVFVSNSASVANASHFRHALALDERRVKFMPEYFQEMNAQHKNMLRPRVVVDSDIQEMWFPGCHADVGGVTRLGEPYHAGNVSLAWMKSEASQKGLRFESGDFTTWVPDDVRSGRTESLCPGWKLLEIMFPFSHQVSFSGTGQNKLKWHWFRPRRIIPGQLFHPSVWCEHTYRPRATLGNGIEIPTIVDDQPLASEYSCQKMSADLVALLFWIRRYAASELADLLRGLKNPCVRDLDPDGNLWLKHIKDQSGFDKFVAIIAYIMAFTDSLADDEVDSLVHDARNCLAPILLSPEHPDLVRTLSLLPHLTMDPTLRQRIVDPVEASSCLIRLLTESPNDTLTLVLDSICHLSQIAEQYRSTIVDLLRNGLEPGKSSGLGILSKLLEMKEPSLVVAALRIIVSLGVENEDHPLPELKSKVQKLAKQRSGFVGLKAVEAFDALRRPDESANDLKFSNILAYLGSSLRLDVEGGDMTEFSRPGCAGRPLLAINGSQIDGDIVNKMVAATKSYNTGRRTVATLTLLKLCRYRGVQQHVLKQRVLEQQVLETSSRQLRRKETSLLAAYTLMTYLKYGMLESGDLSETLDSIAPSVVAMFKKGWFDDAVGLVEGFEIFRQLAELGTLKKAIEDQIYEALKTKLEIREHDGIRTSLRCIDILDRDANARDVVTRLVDYSLEGLRNKPWKKQQKCVNILSALSQIAAGEDTISSHTDEIVEMLLPEYYRDSTASSVPPSQMLGPCSALYSLSRNEVLREGIRQSKRFTTLKGRYLSGSLVTGPDTPLWQVRTPRKSQVLVMMARMIKVVDEGFSYDGIGSIPEAVPVVVLHVSGLVVLFRNGVVRALHLLPSLANGLVQRYRRRSITNANRGEDDGQEPSYLPEWTTLIPLPPSPSPPASPALNTTPERAMFIPLPPSPSPPASAAIHTPIPDSSIVTHSIPPITQPTLNRQEYADAPNRTDSEETAPLHRQETQSIIHSSSLIVGGQHNPRSSHSGDNDDVVEVPRQEMPVIPPQRTTQARTESSHHAQGPPEQEVLSYTSDRTSSRLIMKDFSASDLPTKKYLKLFSPRARLKVRVGNQTRFSPTVKIGNESMDGEKMQTRWICEFKFSGPFSDESIDIEIERQFLRKWTRVRTIRHIVPTSIRNISDGQVSFPAQASLPLYEGM